MSTPPSAPDCPEPLRSWLAQAAQSGALDLHVVADHPPVLRLHGELRELDEPPLDRETVQCLLVPLCPHHAMDRFQADKNVDFAFELTADGQRRRFRRTTSLPASRWAAVSA